MAPRYANSDLTEMRLRSKYLEGVDAAGPLASRVIGYYAGQPVLLEFRDKGRLDSQTAKDRLVKVARFFHKLDSSFHGLNCRGYLRDVGGRYAYVFDLPAAIVVDKSMLERSGRVNARPEVHLTTRLQTVCAQEVHSEHCMSSIAGLDRL
jgi:hypothetical protein